eukprot:828251-Alexandrium_andersonii.AAC.1
MCPVCVASGYDGRPAFVVAVSRCRAHTLSSGGCAQLFAGGKASRGVLASQVIGADLLRTPGS